MPAIIIAFKIPLELQTYQNDFPLGVRFIGAYIDGTDIDVFYYQPDQDEPLNKQRTLEVLPPYAPIPDQGRTLVDILDNTWVVMENTELTDTDGRRRREA